GLALRLKARDHLPAVHPRFQNLESYFATNGLLLLGHEDDAEAAFADFLHQLVRTDHRTRRFGEWMVVNGGRQVRAWGFEEVPRAGSGLEQLLDAPAQGGIVGASAIEIGFALDRGSDLRRIPENAIDALGFHDGEPVRRVGQRECQSLILLAMAFQE